MSDNIAQDIEHAILSRGAHLGLIFSDVDGIKEGASYSSGDCPFCGERGKFSISMQTAVSRCWRASCQWGQGWHNWHNYAQARGSSATWLEFYQGLAKEAGIPWPERDAASQARYEAYTARANALDTAWQICVAALNNHAGAAVREYFRGRGYTDEDIQQMDLGAHPGQGPIVKGLQAVGYGESEIQQATDALSSLQGHPALMLWRDKAGRPMGMMGRALDDRKPKYLYSKGLAKSMTLPGLDRARRHEEALLIESPLGAAYLNAQGLPWPVLALGGAGISKGQIEAIQQAGIKRIILGLDTGADEAIEKTAKQLQAAGLSLLVASWGDIKAPDDLAVAKGLKALETAVNGAERYGAIKGRDLGRQLAGSMALDEERILEEAIKAYEDLDGLDRRDFIRQLISASGWPAEHIQGRLAEADRRLQDKRRLATAEIRLGKAREALGQGDLAGYENELREALLAAEGGAAIPAPSPYLLEDALRDLLDAPGALRFGLAGLDAVASIPRAALSIVAGPSGQGKSTFMLNLMAKQLDMPAHKDERFYFFTYEEPSSHLALKLIMIWAGVTLHDTQNFQAYLNYLKGHRGENEAIEAALAKYKALAESGRLVIDYSMPHLDRLLGILDIIAMGGDTGAIYLDYIQRIPISRPGATRQLELAQITQGLRYSAVAKELAIITASQLNDQDRLREARDIYHEAALVLILKSKADDGPELPDMSVIVDKQRSGASGAKVYLSFERPILRISDKGPGRGIQV